MPALNSDNGSFSIISSYPGFNCTTFDQYRKTGIIEGSYSCVGGVHLNSSTPSGSSNTPPDGSNQLSTGAIAGIVIGLFIGLAGTSGIVLMRLRKRKAEKERNARRVKALSDGYGGKAELDGRKVEPGELDAEMEPHELYAQHDMNEAAEQEPQELP